MMHHWRDQLVPQAYGTDNLEYVPPQPGLDKCDTKAIST